MIFSNIKYALDIVSLDGNSEGKKLKKYAVDETDFIGVHENEPFEIRFKNNTHKRVQVRVSLDGTDVLTGDLASTESGGEMWMVNAYCELNLKAWPESNNGGARFLFTNTDDGVASNTHGVMSSKGVIAVAVFEEGYSPYTMKPYTYTGNTTTTSGTVGGYSFNANDVYFQGSNTAGGDIRINSSSEVHDGDATCDSMTIPCGAAGEYKSMSKSADSRTDKQMSGKSLAKKKDNRRSRLSKGSRGSGQEVHTLGGLDFDSERSVDLEPDASVGAGEFVEQKLSRVAGLKEPFLAETLTLKYKWWTSLRTELRKLGQANSTNGFPGDSESRLDLGNTPRLKSTAKKRRRRGRRKYAELSRFAS